VARLYRVIGWIAARQRTCLCTVKKMGGQSSADGCGWGETWAGTAAGREEENNRGVTDRGHLCHQTDPTSF
jgi:hypothetical protein